MLLHKVFVDATGIIETPTGLGNYSYHLLKAMLNGDCDKFHFTILCQAHLPKSNTLFSLPRERVVFLSARTPVIGPKRDLLIGSILGARINGHNIYHNLSSYLPAFGLKIPTIVTVHDLKYLLLPDLFNNALKAAYYRWIITRSVRKARRIVAVSNATKNSIIKLGINPGKISVIHEAIALPDLLVDETSHTPMMVKEPFFFYIGDGRPHKNLARVLAAFYRLSDTLGEACPNLVIAGKQEESNYRGLTDKPEYRRKIFLLGVISGSLSVHLYKHARALVYPSLYEGFGLPILEAMAMGTPVITSNCSSMPEVAGTAAFLVDPYNIDDIYDAMLKISTSRMLRETLSQRGLRRVKDFSWKKAAHEILQLYGELLS